MEEQNLPKRNWTKLGWITLAVFCLVVAGASGAFYKYKLKKAPAPDVFAVSKTWPSGDDVPLDSAIAIQFSGPVTVEHAINHIEIMPPLLGSWEQGAAGDAIIRFKPQGNLPHSTLITVNVKAGLPSDNGKKLAEDYYFTFTTKAPDNTITFSKDGRSAKFMGFHTDRGVDLEIDIGNEIQKPKLRLYKVPNVETLLNAFRHKKPDYPTQYATYNQYLEELADTSKLTRLTEITDPEQIKKFHFKEPSGLYLLEALDDNKTLNTAWLSLSNIGIHFRQDDQYVYLAAQNFNTGQPENDVTTTFYSLQENVKVIESHVVNGLGQYSYAFPKLVDMIVAQKGSDIMIVPINVPASQAEIGVYSDLNTKKQGFIYTDRPIYQPGDTVYFRGLLRLDNDGLYRLPSAGTKIRVGFQVYPADGVSQEVTTKADGTFSGEFKLPFGVINGAAYLNATTNLSDEPVWNYTDFGTSFEVATYTKPDFGLTAKVNQDEYVRGDTVTATIEGKYFDGRAFAGQNVEYSVYQSDYYETERVAFNKSFRLNGWGGMCGAGFDGGYYGEPVEGPKTITLDQNGKATVKFDTTKLDTPLSKDVTILVQKKDNSGNDINSAATAIVHAGEFNAFFRPSKNAQKAGGAYTYNFRAEQLNGNSLANKQFDYSFVELTYTNDGKQNRKVITSGQTTTNSEGLGTIRGTYPTETTFSYMFVVSSKDSRNNLVEVSEYVYLPEQSYGFDSINTVLAIQSEQNNFKPGDSMRLNIESPADMKVLATFERGRVYDRQWVDLKAGKNSVSFPVLENYTPSITPTFSFFYNGSYNIEGLSVNVPALHKMVNMEVVTNKTQYKTGETAYVTIKTRDANGNPITTKLGVGIVDKAIYALRKDATKPIHSSFYFFRDRSTNASSSLTMVTTNCECGGGGGGGGENPFGKDVDTLFWNPDLQTAADGTVTFPVPVGSATTTWKIITYGSTNNTDLGQGEGEFLVTN